MKKIVLLLPLILIVGVAAYFFVYKKNAPTVEPTTTRTLIPEEKPAQPTASNNDLPAVLPLTKLDGTEVMANTLLGKAILVVFLPDCDHCQREAAEIQKHLSAFKNYTMYFISTANVLEIKQFAEKYKLSGYENVVMAHTEQVYITNSFGYIPTPSLYIYSDGHLVKDFKGETPLESILPALGSK
jgi:cytochrome oxidase Cu insertion factor (SCO1/SenC/PrrC family)